MLQFQIPEFRQSGLCLLVSRDCARRSLLSAASEALGETTWGTPSLPAGLQKRPRWPGVSEEVDYMLSGQTPSVGKALRV